MAPIKFEDHIKEQLEKRRIQPSGSGWDKLEARLDAAESKGGGNSKWWISIAAAVVAALVIAGFVFTTEDKINTPPIVEQPVEEFSAPSVKEKSKAEIEIALEEVEEQPEVKKTSERTSGFQKPPENTQSEIVEAQGVKQEIITDSVPAHVATQKNPEEAVFRSKLEEVIAAVNSVETEEGGITDAEVNALLAEAAKEISRESGKEYSTGMVDASALLEDVEGELDESFRQKVFEMLKDGVIKARTAVATRNN
ncbi:hypothetical protein RM553_05975 [Zunongwangia sp. F363]|uniref:Uncharacterized protein n=1 Tax=Autumnicola tepida TaxID=3075595 RepID=A0ABU3C7T5_9FLAO|nr:hypothetical protein [Zunongwangia sp. F363]MDT0642377.1 hypothetical protein [Zunongwangia sp. F363]